MKVLIEFNVDDFNWSSPIFKFFHNKQYEADFNYPVLAREGEFINPGLIEYFLPRNAFKKLNDYTFTVHSITWDILKGEIVPIIGVSLD